MTTTTRDHHCHAKGCVAPCPPEYLMCGRHWALVPHELRRAVWAAYRPGQCDDMNPSRAWLVAADAAIDAAAKAEAARWDIVHSALRRKTIAAKEALDGYTYTVTLSPAVAQLLLFDPRPLVRPDAAKAPQVSRGTPLAESRTFRDSTGHDK